MSTALTEHLRAQLDKPLLQRKFFFAVWSLVIGFPLSLVWSFASWLRARQRIRRIFVSATHEPWIISVGNVAVGGTGKSPIVRALARLALNSGFDVAILSRGFGRENAGSLVIELGSATTDFTEKMWSGEFADECLEHAVLLADCMESESRVWIAQGVRRSELLDEVLKQRALGVSDSPVRPLVVLLDDGLSQTSLPVHHDVVVWDPRTVVASPRVCLPFGPYRLGWPGEFWSRSLPRADLAIWSRVVDENQQQSFLEAVDQARGILGPALPFSDSENSQMPQVPSGEFIAFERAQLKQVRWIENSHGFSLDAISDENCPSSCVVLTGLARPQRFIETLHSLSKSSASTTYKNGIVVTDVEHLSDHGALSNKARRLLLSANNVIISLKDACRWFTDLALIEKIKASQLYVLCLDVELKSASLNSTQKSFSRLFVLEEERP